jgi:uncharacterized protein involved in exopolysaccharide biosynthesis
MKPAINSELEVVYQPPSQISAVPKDGEESLVDRLRILFERRRFLARCVVIGTGLATILALLLPPRFDSTVRLMPPDDQSASSISLLAGLAGKMGSLGMLAGDALGVKSSGGLFIGILTSRTVQDDLIQKADLRKVYGTKRWESARKRLAANTSIGEDRKSGIITITTSDQDPQRAALLAGEYVSELNAVVSQLSTSSARREREFLEGRLKEVRQGLETAEKEFGDFSSKNTAIDIKEQARAMVGAAASLQGELIATQSQLEGLKQIYTENNVRVRALRARVNELQAELTKMGGKYEDPSASSDSKDDSLYPSIRKLPVLGVAYADLYRRTKVQEAIFETLTQQYELAKVAEAKEIPSVKFLDSPDVPERRAAPSRTFIVFLGAFLSFAFGALWVLQSDYWRKLDPDSPGKVLARDAFESVRAKIPAALQRKLFRSVS